MGSENSIFNIEQPIIPTLSELQSLLFMAQTWVNLVNLDQTSSDFERDDFDESPSLVDWNDLIAEIDTEMMRIGWSKHQGQGHLQAHYGVESRKKLTDDQLFEFLAYLKQQPPQKSEVRSHSWEVKSTDFKVGQTAIFQGIEVLIERLVNQVVALVRSLENIKARPFEVAIIHLSPVG